MFENPDRAARCALLARVKNIAVAGLSPNPARPRARAASMTVIMDRCIYRDYRKECA
jgi:predicted CoA-binding protein